MALGNDQKRVAFKMQLLHILSLPLWIPACAGMTTSVFMLVVER